MSEAPISLTTAPGEPIREGDADADANHEAFLRRAAERGLTASPDRSAAAAVGARWLADAAQTLRDFERLRAARGDVA